MCGISFISPNRHLIGGWRSRRHWNWRKWKRKTILDPPAGGQVFRFTIYEMDYINLHKAYFSYLHEAEYKEPPLVKRSKREAIIVYLERELNDEKSRFMGVYGYVIRRISPRLSRMRQMVYIPELGGHIEICEDEREFEELLDKQVEMLAEAEKIYNSIQDTEQIVLREKRLLEAEKTAEIHKKLRAKYYDKVLESERWTGFRNPKQMEIFQTF